MKLKIYTDGSCLGNPGPGGWAYLIEVEDKKIRGQGGEPGTTNNRMEMRAAIEGIKDAAKQFPDAEQIELYSDSSLLINTMTKNWKRKKNTDLWDELIPLVMHRKVTWHWVRGHNGHPQNEDCDARAQREAGKQPRTLPEESGRGWFD